MISKKEYLESRNKVDQYEKQLKDSIESPVKCWILKGSESVGNIVNLFVTTDENYAQRVYNKGNCIMIESELIDPMR